MGEGLNIITMEDTFKYVLQHMDDSARISKWIVQLQEFDYTVIMEKSTRAALADILTHQFKEKKEKKELKQLTPPAPPTVKRKHFPSILMVPIERKKAKQQSRYCGLQPC